MCDFHICCDDLSRVDNCSNTTCESGCFCSNGNVLLDGVCIHPNVCPSKLNDNDAKVIIFLMHHLFTMTPV